MHRVPIYVAVPHVAKRQRSEDVAFFLHHADVEIRELPSSEAPIAAEGRLGSGPATAWRFHSGSLWRPVLETGRLRWDGTGEAPSFAPLPHVLTERLPPGRASADDPFGATTIADAVSGNQTVLARMTFGASHPEPFSPAHGRTTEPDCFDAAAAAAARTAGDLLLVDGVLHRRSDPPMLVLDERSPTRAALPATGSWVRDASLGLVRGWLVPLAHPGVAETLTVRLACRPNSGIPEGLPTHERRTIDGSAWGSIPSLACATSLERLALACLASTWRSDALRHVHLCDADPELLVSVGTILGAARPGSDPDAVDAGIAAVAAVSSSMDVGERHRRFGPLPRIHDAADAALLVLDAVRRFDRGPSPDEESALAMGI